MENNLSLIIDKILSSDKKIIILSGDLGSGKTYLVKEFAKKFGIDDVSSPTFSIQNIYNNIYHYDIYNKTKEEFISLGLLEELEKDGFHFIEWGEKIEDILKDLGFEYQKIIIKKENNKRKYILV